MMLFLFKAGYIDDLVDVWQKEYFLRMFHSHFHPSIYPPTLASSHSWSLGSTGVYHSSLWTKGRDTPWTDWQSIADIDSSQYIEKKQQTDKK